ncbi:MAG: WYL domain-containing transcriptional regulator [Cryomorphaceae bacterium]|nr:WYL domain-containing transcriptional regulator [Cryomorphaceae bacterium]
MTDHKRIYRIFQMIARLRGPMGLCKKTIAEDFEVSERTIERYLQLLKDIGFEITKHKERFKLVSHNDSRHLPDDLVAFTVEEAAAVRDVMVNTDLSGHLQKSILDKLYALTDMDEMAETLYNITTSKNISEIRKAIKAKQSIWLKNYESVNSSTIKDRLVEPFRFFDYYNYLLAYEVESQMVKQYKTGRIETVKATDKSWQYQDKHHYTSIDIFGMGGDQQIPIRLQLGLRAKRLLIEEHPGATTFIRKSGQDYIFEAPVNSLEGVSRFVAGLMDDITIEQPEALKTHIEKKVKNFLLRH